jgi:hypothetical protein
MRPAEFHAQGSKAFQVIASLELHVGKNDAVAAHATFKAKALLRRAA